ncbi:prolyl oligopeptidase family serine peptidase [Actinosynnema sp. NPDC047251]|nr:prolyl oligopeptidase family serine peptidase [Saccharothrix espanaensis]
MPRTCAIDDLWADRVPSHPAISADGTRAVFVRGSLDRDGDRVVLGGAWSPDGKRLAVVTLGAYPDPTAPLVVDTAFHKADGLGRFGGLRLDLVVLDVVVLDVAFGELTRPVTGLPVIDGVTWSPDGTTIAYVTHRDDRWDTTFTGAVETVEVAAPELDRGVHAGPGGAADQAVPLRFTPDGRTLYFAVRDQGLTHLHAVDWSTPDAPARRVFGSTTESLNGLAVAGTGRPATILSTVDSFPEVVLLDGTRVVHRTALSGNGPARLIPWGYSYGGYATCYLTSHHPEVFAAAVAGGVVSDLAALRAASPIAKVREVTAPTLLLHAADDQRCPVGQSEQWFVGPRETGVPTRLVLYPGASHLFVLLGRPSQRVDYRHRLLARLAQHVR